MLIFLKKLMRNLKMEHITINNLEKYQHYSDRNMIWFKFYIDILQDFKFMELSDKDKWVFIGLICLACKNNNKIPNDIKWLDRTLNVSGIEKSLATLTNIKMIASCYQNAIPIREEEIIKDKIRLDKNIYSQILEHWNSFKTNTHKTPDKAIKEIDKLLKSDETFENIQQTINNYFEIINGKEYYFKYKWTLWDFLKRGFEKFKDLEIAKSNYKIKSFNKPEPKQTTEEYTNGTKLDI